MHKRIAIVSDGDPFLPVDYSLAGEDARRSMGWNSGNRVFQFAIRKMTLTDKAQVEFVSLERIFKYPEDVDAEYDAIVYSPANILSLEFRRYLEQWAELVLTRIKHASIYFIGCGSDGKPGDAAKVASGIRVAGYQLIKGILDSGGAIALRGNYTANVVKKIGFSDRDFVVLGCPSLYMNGRGLHIEKPQLSRKKIKPILNGSLVWLNSKYHCLFREYTKSIFICQDLAWNLLYDGQSICKRDAYYLQSTLFERLYMNKRIRLYGDCVPWIKDIKNEGYNFSYGSRIHGNIVSLLAGIPAYISAENARVWELAHFFKIPHDLANRDEKPDIYKIYELANYDDFNKFFPQKYDNFVTWFHDHDLPCFEDKTYIEKAICKISFPTPEYRTQADIIHQFTQANTRMCRPHFLRCLRKKICNLLRHK